MELLPCVAGSEYVDNETQQALDLLDQQRAEHALEIGGPVLEYVTPVVDHLPIVAPAVSLAGNPAKNILTHDATKELRLYNSRLKVSRLLV